MRNSAITWSTQRCWPNLLEIGQRFGILTRLNSHNHELPESQLARVTVEDCIDKVDNRFELVLLAAHRARLISSGAQITVDRDNDKNPVVALREIADDTLSPDDLKEDLIHSLQKYVEVDEPEHEETLELPATGEDAAQRAVFADVDDKPEPEVTFDKMSEDELLPASRAWSRRNRPTNTDPAARNRHDGGRFGARFACRRWQRPACVT